MTEQKACALCGAGGHLAAQCSWAKGERAKFEAWVIRERPGSPLHYIRDALPVDDPRYGEYCDVTLQSALEGWLACAAQAWQGPVIQICKLGNYGKAYDGPNECRAYTYAEQPGNPGAWKLGEAAHSAMQASAGDHIDRGLVLLRELQAKGFGVFELAAPQPAKGDQP